jgi:hypothetical protein
MPDRTENVHARSTHGAPLVAAILVLPAAVFLAVWSAVLSVKGPYWLGSNLDPDYVYLMNGLNVFSGFAPGQADHPGTTLQALIAGVIGLAHAWTGSGSVADDVLGRPEHYLLLSSIALLVLFALGLAWAGLATLRATGSAAAAVAVQAIPALASRVLSQIVCVKPDALVLALAAALVAVTVSALATDREPGMPRALAFGGVIGLLACTKIIAAPLALVPLLLLRGAAARLAFVLAAAVAFAVAFAPAYSMAEVFGSFLLGIATHSGSYGSGARSLFDAGRYAGGLLQMAKWNPDLVFVIAGGAAIWILARRKPELRGDRRVRALGGALAAQIATLLIAARHPGPNYAIPATALSGLTVVLAAWIAPRVVVERRKVVLALVLPLAAFFSFREAVMGRERYRTFQRDTTEHLAAAAAARAIPGASIVYYYRASAPVYALRFGDEYTAGRWTSWLSAHHPGAIFFNAFTGAFSSYGPGNVLPPSRDRVLLFQGSTLGVESFTDTLAHHGLEPVFSGPFESVYRAPGIW